jgi:hypothetical protein
VVHSNRPPGRACVYLPVLAMLACPSVACTMEIGAPRSNAWEVCAWRNQCGETLPVRPSAPQKRAERVGRLWLVPEIDVTVGGWTARQIHEAVLTTFQLSPKPTD